MSSPDTAYRFPLMPAEARIRLLRLEEHPNAPRFTHPGVDRVTAAGLERLAAYDGEVHGEPPRWAPRETPSWLPGFIRRCYRTVPFFLRQGSPPALLEDVPPCSRADLAHAPWDFVPDDEPLDDLIVYNTSGTTGHPLAIPTHPDTLALYVPLLRAGLARYGIDLEGDVSRPAAIVQVCWQRQTYTMAGLVGALDWAGFVKINLAAADWRSPEDPVRYIEACDPEILTGDPLSFAELARTSVQLRPKALASTAMALSPEAQEALGERFSCPVLDFYSLNESGPVGVRGPGEDAFSLLQPRLFVEVLDAEGRNCPPGVEGEVVLTGGFNRLLPLLRYRTGDAAALSYVDDRPVLHGLGGRPPVVFTAAAGHAVNNVDVSNALRPLGLGQYMVHQEKDGALTLSLRDAVVDEAAVRTALETLFGRGLPLTIRAGVDLGPPDGKIVQYTRDVGERAVS